MDKIRNGKSFQEWATATDAFAKELESVALDPARSRIELRLLGLQVGVSDRQLDLVPAKSPIEPASLTPRHQQSRQEAVGTVRSRLTTIRFDADVLDALKASGPGWQTRVNDALRADIRAKRL